VFKSTKLQVRLYGGATYFSVKQEVITDFTYDESYSIYNVTHTITITGYTSKFLDSKTAFGFNAGGDVGYFFTKNIGVGGDVRYARASLTIPNSAQDLYQTGQTQVISVGGLSLGVGLRARF
jgi:hypothetical protein